MAGEDAWPPVNPGTAFVVTVLAMLAAVGVSLFTGVVAAAEAPPVFSEEDGRHLLMGAFALVGAAVILRSRGDL